MTTRVTELAARAEALSRTRRAQIVLALLLVAFGLRHVTRSMGDFKTYHLAAHRAVAGETVYRLDDEHRYLYAPVVTFLFFPLAVLPALLGRVLWFAFNIVLLVSIFRSTATLLFPGERAPPGFYALVLLLSFRFIDNNIGHGQINILMLWLVLRAYVLAVEKRHVLAGFAMAAAVATKIIPILFLVQIVLRRQWRFALWTLVGGAVLLVVPVVWWGSAYPAVVRDWVAVVIDQAGHYEMGNKINQSISAFAYRLFRPYPGGHPVTELSPAAVDAIVIALHALFLAPLLALSLRLSTNGREEPPQGPGGDELALYLLYSTVASPYSWKYYFVNIIFPVGCALRRVESGGQEAPRFAWGLGIVFVLNLFAGLELLGKKAATLFQLWSFHFLGVALLFALLLRTAHAEASRRSGP